MENEFFSKEHEMRNNIIPLKINKGTKSISKTQQAFNRLTSRISKLQEKIRTDTEKLTLFSTRYNELVSPEIVTLGKNKIQLSHLLHEKRKTEKLSHRLNDKLDELILQLLDDAFSVIEPDEKTRELFEVYYGESFDDAMQDQREEMSEAFSSYLYEFTGLKIDAEELKKETPDFEKLQRDMEEQMRNNSGKENSKKSKKALEKEAQEAKKEEIKKKSLRSIYLSLAKILHPDTEQEEKLRMEKEEYMKKVTAAYQNKDLTQLLQLEIIWVNNHEKTFQDTPEDVLKVYVQLLKDQVQDLEVEAEMVISDPAYANVINMLSWKNQHAFLQIDTMQSEYIHTHTKYAEVVANLEKGNRNRQVIVKCIEDFYIDDDEDDFLPFH